MAEHSNSFNRKVWEETLLKSGYSHETKLKTLKYLTESETWEEVQVRAQKLTELYKSSESEEEFVEMLGGIWMEKEEKNLYLSGTQGKASPFQLAAESWEKETTEAEQEIIRYWKERLEEQPQLQGGPKVVNVRESKAYSKSLDKRYGKGNYVTENVHKAMKKEDGN